MLFVNIEHSPLILVVAVGEIDVGDVEQMERGLREAFAPGNPIYVVTDARAGKRPNAMVRSALAETTNRLEPLSRAQTRGSAVIVSSAVIAGTVRAIRWLIKDEDSPDFFNNAQEVAQTVGRALFSDGDLPAPLQKALAMLDTADGDIEKLVELRLVPPEAMSGA
mgnify:CR=1 FL=1